MTRRRFAAALGAAPQSWQWATAASDAERQAYPFPLGQVQLLDPNCRLLAERNRAYLLSLEPDRLLHMFRVTAGLPSTAQHLGGWERPDIELRGHFLGHYLSACALQWSGVQHGELRQRGSVIVAELAKCQKAHGNGYLSAFPPEFFERLKAGQKVWAPFYTLHKIMAGLLDMHVLGGSNRALDVVRGMADWVAKWAAPLDDTHMARILDREFGGMNEVLYNLYDVTRNEAYATLAHRFDHPRIFDPLAQGRDELKGLHSNTQIPKIIGAARRYEITGERRYREIAEFFWGQVTGHRAYCTGGTSNLERWNMEPDRLASELSSMTQECCCTYNLLKLTRHLYTWNAEARYADYYERAFFNGVLGTMNPEDGMTVYYVPLAPGYWKMYALPRDSFWCCTGTGVESFSKLAESIYFHDNDGIWVNLFLDSHLAWPEKGLRIRQETRFPEQEKSEFLFEVERTLPLTLRIRVPHWATQGFRVAINGQAHPATPVPGSYCSLQREWKSGDRVTVSLPMALHLSAMPDDETLQAFLYGPLVLAGELGREGLTRELEYGDAANPINSHARADSVPAPDLHARNADSSSLVRPVPGKTLTFRTSGQKRDITLVPLYRLFNQRYAVYWRVRQT
jgi:uncharacterized protein